jgi:predicted ester cyclase
MFRAAFPDLYLHIEDEIAEGDRIVTPFTAHGTHHGDLMGIPPTDKQVTGSGMNIARITGGKIMGRREIVDMMRMMVQLGVVPPPVG